MGTFGVMDIKVCSTGRLLAALASAFAMPPETWMSSTLRTHSGNAAAERIPRIVWNIDVDALVTEVPLV